MNYSGVSGDVAGAMAGTSLSRLGINSSGDVTAYGDVKIAAEKVLELGAVASLGYEAASDDVQYSGKDIDFNGESLLNQG
jgi:adhesin HecA-like repeat protein